MMSQRKTIVCIGGGTGQVPVIHAFKKMKGIRVCSVVCMTDSGGSSGRLRRRLTILPPGDLLKNILALSRWGNIVSHICSYRITRFPLRAFRGHSIGNLIVAFFLYVFPLKTAVFLLNTLFLVKGRVLPVTGDICELFLEMDSGMIGSEDIIDTESLEGVKRVFLNPAGNVYKEVLQNIHKADMIVLSPGDLYTSLLASLVVNDISPAIIRSSARKVYIANLVNKVKHTPDFSIDDYLDEIKRFTGITFDTVLYNSTEPDPQVFKNYVEMQRIFLTNPSGSVHSVGCDLISNTIVEKVKGDEVERSYLRHDPNKLRSAFKSIGFKNDIHCFVFDFDRTLGDCNNFDFEKRIFPLYEDAVCLKRRASSYISVLSSGNYHLQREKILRSGIQIDDFLLTKYPEQKVKKIKRLLDKYGAPIIFVDDRAIALDAIRDVYGDDNILLYHIVREDSKYPEQFRYEHPIINSLKPILDKVKIENERG